GRRRRGGSGRFFFVGHSSTSSAGHGASCKWLSPKDNVAFLTAGGAIHTNAEVVATCGHLPGRPIGLTPASTSADADCRQVYFGYRVVADALAGRRLSATEYRIHARGPRHATHWHLQSAFSAQADRITLSR